MGRDADSDRSIALKAAYRSARDRLSITEEEFLKAAESWEVYPVAGGAVLTRGEEIHACVNEEAFGKWLSRRVLRDTLYRVLEKYGRAITTVSVGNEAGERFVARLGFQKIEEQEGIGIWELKQQSAPG